MAVGYSVSLTVAFQSNYMINNDYGFRLTVTAGLTTGLPLIYGSTVPSNYNSTCTPITGLTSAQTSAVSVFRYVQKPVAPDGTVESVFSGVCSWPDYTELPVAIPFANSLPASFRLNTIDLVVESETVANEVWLLVQQQVTQLMQTISDGQALTFMTTPVPCSSQ
jgi:hypothetical protein